MEPDFKRGASLEGPDKPVSRLFDGGPAESQTASEVTGADDPLNSMPGQPIV